MDRLYKTALDILTENQQTVHCEVLRDTGHIVQWQVLTGNRQTLEECSEHSDTDQTDLPDWDTRRQWTDCRKSSGNRNTEPKDGTVWGIDSGQNKEESSDRVTRNQQKVQCEVLKNSGQTVHFEVLTGIRHTIEESIGLIDTETTDITVWGTDLLSTVCLNHHWTQWRNSNGRYTVR